MQGCLFFSSCKIEIRLFCCSAIPEIMGVTDKFINTECVYNKIVVVKLIAQFSKLSDLFLTTHCKNVIYTYFQNENIYVYIISRFSE